MIRKHEAANDIIHILFSISTESIRAQLYGFLEERQI